MKLSTAEQMRKMDSMAVEKGIQDIVLMENAALKSFNEVAKRMDVRGKRVVVFCGAGNNGGDGLAIARHLHNAHANVHVYLLVDPIKLKGSPKANYEILQNMGVPVGVVRVRDDFNTVIVDHADIIVDAVFGTGLTREVSGLFRYAIELINSAPRAFRVSVDIPSGVVADTGKVMGVAVRADLTPTFAFAKPGHIFYPGREYAGEVVVVDISTPRDIIDNFEPDFVAVTPEDVRLKGRSRTSHKGTYGHLVVVGGSLGKSGAVIMATVSALRCGVGLVSACVPVSINTAFESYVLEGMSFPVKDRDGFISSDSIPSIREFVSDKTAIVVGMGMGITDDTKDVVKSLLETDKPMVVDADGINVLAGMVNCITGRKYPTILTPHPKEFARLTGLTTTEVIKNRIELIRGFSAKTGAIVVLKMADTMIGTPDGKIYINTSGNPGLATGGSGDVLSGIIGGFLAQGYSPIEASVFGVFVHGYAADLALDEVGVTSMIPSDVIKYIGEAIEELSGQRAL